MRNDEVARMEESNAELKAKVKELQDWVERVKQPPWFLGRVIQRTARNTLLVSHDNTIMECGDYPKKRLKAGDMVRLQKESFQIIEPIESLSYGQISSIKRVVDDTTCELSVGAETKLLFYPEGMKLSQGDRVVLDSSDMIVVQNLGKQNSSFNFSGDSKVTWDDIGGLEEAKQQLIEIIEFPHKYPGLYKFYNRPLPKGALLFGPPGNGKTMLVKAAWNALVAIYGGADAAREGFIYTKGPELLDKYVGETERMIREGFQHARQFKEQHGFPAIWFIDEADAILKKRGTSISSDVNDTHVPMFLSEMDGMGESSVIVILATNRPDTLDPAVVREGRIDRKIEVTRPNYKAADQIFRIHLKDRKTATDTTLAKLATAGVERLFSPLKVLYKIEYKNGETEEVRLEHIISGALVANCVDQAISLAIQRDISLGRTEKGTGLGRADIETAVDNVFKQNIHTNHDDHLNHIIGGRYKEVKEVKAIGKAA